MNEKTYGICIYIKEQDNIKILLCKASTDSHNKWGFVKGGVERNETPKEAAKREFYEECGIKVGIKYFEEYFEQTNLGKDIGIWLVNSKSVKNFNKYFDSNLTLKAQYLSMENSDVKFFELDKLPNIKDKQKFIALKIMNYFKV